MKFCFVNSMTSISSSAQERYFTLQICFWRHYFYLILHWKNPDLLGQISTQHCECWEDTLSWSSQGHQSNLLIKVTIFPNMSLNIKVSSMSDLPCPPLNNCGSMVADSVEEVMNNKVDYWMYFEYTWLIISILRSPLCMTFHVLPLKALEIG